MYTSRETFFKLGGAMLAVDTTKDPNKITVPCILQPKYDGIRAIYFPVEKKLISRQNKEITGCPSILSELDKLNLREPVDGEILVRGKSFNDASGVIRRTPTNLHPDEEDCYYVIFDVVTVGNIKERLSTLPNSIPVLDVYQPMPTKIRIYQSVTKTKFKGKHILENLTNLLDEGFEGIILRNPNSTYEFKRTKNLLKLKQVFFATAEVIDLEEGKGRLTGTLGNLVLKNKEGKIFSVGSGLSDILRKDLWKRGLHKGDTVKYQYQELSRSGIPRFPVFIEHIYTPQKNETD